MKSRVFVGLSGGVDSSVSAALLKQSGYEVTGVFIKVWRPDFLPCSEEKDRLDAMRVAATLDIPFLTLDLETEYKKEVFDSMIGDYAEGKTPNPDVLCNRAIKFGAFYDFARSRGADYIATGHYARVAKTKSNYEILRGVDEEKDQSYFLWMVRKGELAHVLFPIGDLRKGEVRKLANKFNLPTASKKDSQGLCFLGKLNMKDFLKHFLPEKNGLVVDEGGVNVGSHSGAHLYALGERHGFNVHSSSAHDYPRYVVSKNVKENIVTVSEYPLKFAGRKKITIKDVNFFGEGPVLDKKYESRLRYRQPLFSCFIEKVGEDFIVVTDTSQLADPGQSLVIYDGDRIIGGGIISGF